MAHDHGRPGPAHSGPAHPGPAHSGHAHSGFAREAHDHARRELDGEPGLDGEWEDGEEWDDLDDEVDIKEAFGLPDVLPPLRLPSDAELAARARAVPMLAELAALAAWVGEEGRVVDEDAELSGAERAQAMAALGVPAERLACLWKYAGAVDWITEPEEGRVTSGQTAAEWADGGDEGALSAWSATFAAVLTEAMCVAAGAEPGRPRDADLHVPGASVAMLFFMARREGLTLEEVSEVIEETVLADLPPRAEREWKAYREAHGDLAAVLVAQLAEAGAVTAPSPEDGTFRLTPLAMREMRLQFTDAGVDVELLPDSPAEMTARQLVALADGVPDDEFEAESAAWLAARDPGEAATELLGVAAAGDAADRLLAVAVVTELGQAAEAAWRDRLQAPALRPYAKMALVRIGGLQDEASFPPDLEPDADDLSWMATDLLAIACADEDTDAGELEEAFAEAMPPDGEAGPFLDLLARGPHPDAPDVLKHIGEYHPDKAIAKQARRVLYKASMRQAAASPADHR